MLQNMTNVRLSSGIVALTLPRDIARAISIYDREDVHVEYRVRCQDDGLGLSLVLGDAADADSRRATKAIVRSNGMVELRPPTFLANVWGLVDLEVTWPDAETVACEPDESVQIDAEVPEWEPPVEVDVVEALADGTSARSFSVVERDDGVRLVRVTIPDHLVRRVGMSDADRIRVDYTCAGGRVMLVASPTDASKEDLPNSLALDWTGPDDNQAQFAAKEVAAQFGIDDARGRSLRWFEADGRLFAFPKAEDGAE